MGKISYKDKTLIKTLQKLGISYRTIVTKFPEKRWNLNSVKTICRPKLVDEHGAATEQKPGSSRPKQHKQMITLDTLSR